MNLVATFGKGWKTVHDTIRTVTVVGSDLRAAPQPIVPMSLPLAIPWRVAFQQSSPLLYQPSVILKEKRKFEKKNPKAAGVPNNLCHLRGSPQPFQSNFGPTQERDKWRVPL